MYSRKAGRQRYIDFHLLVDPQETIDQAHTVCDTLERAIQQALPGAVVHIHLEPDDGRYRGPEQAGEQLNQQSTQG